MLAALGDAGREFYLTRIVRLDLVFPLAYTLFFAVTITWLLSRRLPEGSPWIRLNVVPLIAGAADYGENIGSSRCSSPTRPDSTGLRGSPP
ncbi:MAG: hypothetical protein PWR21_1192 [Methanoculleus sp.]|nr:hypothetical protein [Methanoculleus sp.]MDK2989488.1 hypothetical protein [Methanoculleus sp.]